MWGDRIVMHAVLHNWNSCRDCLCIAWADKKQHGWFYERLKLTLLVMLSFMNLWKFIKALSKVLLNFIFFIFKEFPNSHSHHFWSLNYKFTHTSHKAIWHECKLKFIVHCSIKCINIHSLWRRSEGNYDSYEN